MIDRNGEPMVVAADSLLAADCPALDRLLALVHSACAEALSTIGHEAVHRGGLSIFVGLPEPRPGLPEDLVHCLVAGLRKALSPEWSPDRIIAVQKGHSAGLLAVAMAAEQARGGSSALHLAAGVDSYLDPLTLEWLDANDQLHSIHNAWGFVPGEAAGCCLVGNTDAAVAAGIERPPIIQASALASERNRIKTDTVCVGEGLSQVLDQSTSGLTTGLRVDELITDMNGEPYRAEELGYAIVRHSKRFADASGYTAPADCWGDVGAASGPLFAVLAEAAARRGYASGPRTVCCTSSEAGERAALLIEAPVGNWS